MKTRVPGGYIYAADAPQKGILIQALSFEAAGQTSEGERTSLPLKFQLRHSDSSWLDAHVPEKGSVIAGARPTSFSGKAGLETPPNIP